MCPVWWINLSGGETGGDGLEESPLLAFLWVKGQNPVSFICTDGISFGLLAYERDNQHQDEAEDDPENGREPQDQGPQETDLESEADVSVLSFGHDTWTRPREERKLEGLPDATPLAPALAPDGAVISSARNYLSDVVNCNAGVCVCDVMRLAQKLFWENRKGVFLCQLLD